MHIISTDKVDFWYRQSRWSRRVTGGAPLEKMALAKSKKQYKYNKSDFYHHWTPSGLEPAPAPQTKI